MSLHIHSISAASSLAAEGAGANCPISAPAPLGPSCWAEEYVARRNAAAAFLGAQRQQGADAECLPYWRVPGFVSLFDDAQLMDWARQRGWSHG